jgi:1-acyl-sn-glycerol-3-phosphate acyltransferase
VFYVLFMGQTIILAIVVGVIAMTSRRRELSWRIAQYWRNSNIALLRVIVGVETDVRGGENIPPGPCIFASPPSTKATGTSSPSCRLPTTSRRSWPRRS